MFTKVLPTGDDVYTVFDMSTQEIEKVEKRMRPNGHSISGFLAKGENLKEICVADLQVLEKLGVSCEQISDTLRGLIKKAYQIAKNIPNIVQEVVINGKFKLHEFELCTDAFQECPFTARQHTCHRGRKNYTITNLRTKESITFSELIIPLIGKHAFFEGNTPYRLDPKEIYRVLELKPGKYKKVTKKWYEFHAIDNLDSVTEEVARKNAKKVVPIDKYATAYLGLTSPKSKRTRKIYCYIYNHKRRQNTGLDVQIEGCKFSAPISRRGVYVFIPRTETYAEM